MRKQKTKETEHELIFTRRIPSLCMSSTIVVDLFTLRDFLCVLFWLKLLNCLFVLIAKHLCHILLISAALSLSCFTSDMPSSAAHSTAKTVFVILRLSVCKSLCVDDCTISLYLCYRLLLICIISNVNTAFI